MAVTDLRRRLAFLAPDFLRSVWRGKPPPGEETQACVQLANELRAATLEGRMTAVWFHPANEFGGVKQRAFGALRLAMGRWAGIPDYCFGWDNGILFIEMKGPKKSLSEPQERFARWCQTLRVPFHLCHSMAEALAILEQAGVYRRG